MSKELEVIYVTEDDVESCGLWQEDTGIEFALLAYGSNPEGFSPLTDDGDSRRLQVKLRIDVKWVYGCWIAERDDISASVIGRGDIEGDDLRACREAVFQVAVQIGKEMK